MMYTLSWLHRRARVWVAALPPWCDEFEHCTQSAIIQEEILSTSRKLDEMRLAAAEVFVPRGAMVDYGALGVHFAPHSTDYLRIQVPVLEHAMNGLLRDSLASVVDTVRIGLPAEYTRAVAAGILGSDAAAALGSGDLRIRCAAHGEVGSSPDMFSRLASFLVELLVSPQGSLTHLEVLALLRRRFELQHNDT